MNSDEGQVGMEILKNVREKTAEKSPLSLVEAIMVRQYLADLHQKHEILTLESKTRQITAVEYDRLLMWEGEIKELEAIVECLP